MKLLRRSHVSAILCVLLMLACEFISYPFTTMNVCDDGPYIRMAQTFARTGHIVYNGWEAAMILAQIYLAQPFIKLFGDSFTSIRMSTLPLAMITGFLFHRTLVRTGISERNATLGTLAVVISPMYLMLSVTFMTDIAGMLAITLCLYACLRALRASADRSVIAWICFAVVTCAFLGTSRQIAWLGDLVMVPSTLWLLRSRRRVLIAGAVATALAALFILGCTHWLAKQPYVVPAPLLAKPFPLRIALLQLGFFILEIPFLVLPIIAVFAPRIFKTRPYIRFLLLVLLLAYIVVAFHFRRDADAIIRLEPTAGNWVNVFGAFTGIGGPLILNTKAQLVLTAICIAGLLGVVAVFLPTPGAKSSPLTSAGHLSWRELEILLLPFSLAYLVLLVLNAGTILNIFDRYGIGLFGPVMIVLIRLYQERVQPRLPSACGVLIIIAAIYGVISTHNTFALDRARVSLANELHAHGVPFTAIDGGWDYNLDTELDNSNHINEELIKVPAGAYVTPPPTPPGYCPVFWGYRVPHIRAVYSITFYSKTCYGKAPFAPVQYRPWPLGHAVDLYAVRFAPPGE